MSRPKIATVWLRDQMLTAIQSYGSLTTTEVCAKVFPNDDRPIRWYSLVYPCLRAMATKGDIIWTPARGKKREAVWGNATPRHPSEELESLWEAI